MTRTYGIWVCLFLVLAAIAGRVPGAQRNNRVDDKALRNASEDTNEWLMTGRNYAANRYSPLDQINTKNVSQLGLAWYYETNSYAGALEATPIFSNGVLYGSLSWDVVFALDAHTGKELWRYDPHISQKPFAPGTANTDHPVRTGPTICCGPVNRGVALYDGKVYEGLLDGKLIALDQNTGKLVWSVQTTDPSADYSSSGAPIVADGKVIIGNAGADFATRGYVTAYNAETGKQVWRAYTVPGDPSKPQADKALARAVKTWKGDEWYKIGGGGNVWNAFAYDPDLKLLYFGTGNGSPWSQGWRSPGGGDNLYVNSIIAVHADTGKYAWYFQETPGGEWDYDAVEDLILANLKIDGKMRKVIMQAPKSGFFYVIDRKTGKFISAEPITKINWATGVDPRTGRPIENPQARYDQDKRGAWIAPGGGGVHSWHAMSFNPNTGLVYVPGATSIMFYKDSGDYSHHLGQYAEGLDRATPRWVDGMRLGTVGTFDAPPPPQGYRFGSFLVAWDPVTQKERWRVAGLNGGGTVTTAGDLVFASANNGQFVALNAETGERLWSSTTFSGLSNPSTYMIDDKQYVSVLAGTAGHGRLYTFALGGTAKAPDVVTPGPGQISAQDGVYAAEQAERGKTQYAQNCALCHGANLMGIGQNPALAGKRFTASWNGHSVDNLFSVMDDSMPKGNPGSLSPSAYTDIIAYVLQANHFPAGKEELKSTREELSKVLIIVPPRSAGPTDRQ